jgi:cell division protein FtsL
MKHLTGFRWLLIALVAVLIVSFIFSFPVYKQNRYTRLMREQSKLNSEVSQLRNRLALTELRMQRLFDRTRIESFAKDRLDLGYHNPPVLLEVSQ